VNPSTRTRSAALNIALSAYQRDQHPLPGIEDEARRDSFVRQLLDSTRRTEYVGTMRKRELSASRSDPNNSLFDPILGAIVCHRAGEIEEAFWLAFLATHFGKALSSKWELCRAVYGRLESGQVSSWDRTRTDTEELCSWIVSNAEQIKSGPPPRKFGNHRKYEPLIDKAKRGTPAAIRSYVGWIMTAGSHEKLVERAMRNSDNDPYLAFDQLYASMSAVVSFGRLARFDYLSMLGKLGLAPITAGSTYLSASTGPLTGAALLFFNSTTASQPARVMDRSLRKLGEALQVTMQDLEDALCNWQKSPNTYRRFSG